MDATLMRLTTVCVLFLFWLWGLCQPSLTQAGTTDLGDFEQGAAGWVLSLAKPGASFTTTTNANPASSELMTPRSGAFFGLLSLKRQTQTAAVQLTYEFKAEKGDNITGWVFYLPGLGFQFHHPIGQLQIMRSDGFRLRELYYSDNSAGSGWRRFQYSFTESGAFELQARVQPGPFADTLFGMDGIVIEAPVREPPKVTAPADIVLTLKGGSAGIKKDDASIQAFLAGASAIDDQAGPLQVSVLHTPELFPKGVTEIHFQATDQTGNMGEAVALVTVEGDITAPEISVPDPLTIIIKTGGTGVSASDPRIQKFLKSTKAIDAMDGEIPLTHSQLPDPVSVGKTKVFFMATDLSGNTGKGAGEIRVQENHSPEPQADFAQTQEGTRVLIEVLANDIEVDGHRLKIRLAAPPDNGVYILADNKKAIWYVPYEGFTGDDAFSYEVDDGFGGSAEARVQVHVTNKPETDSPTTARVSNTDPIARYDFVPVFFGKTAILDVLQNDSDPDNDRIGIIALTQPETASVELLKGGRIKLVHNRDDKGYDDSFTYTLSDFHGGTSVGIVTMITHFEPRIDIIESPRFICDQQPSLEKQPEHSYHPGKDRLDGLPFHAMDVFTKKDAEAIAPDLRAIDIGGTLWVKGGVTSTTYADPEHPRMKYQPLVSTSTSLYPWNESNIHRTGVREWGDQNTHWEHAKITGVWGLRVPPYDGFTKDFIRNGRITGDGTHIGVAVKARVFLYDNAKDARLNLEFEKKKGPGRFDIGDAGDVVTSVGFEPAREVGAGYEQAWLADAGGKSSFFFIARKCRAFFHVEVALVIRRRGSQSFHIRLNPGPYALDLNIVGRKFVKQLAENVKQVRNGFRIRHLHKDMNYPSSMYFIQPVPVPALPPPMVTPNYHGPGQGGMAGVEELERIRILQLQRLGERFHLLSEEKRQQLLDRLRALSPQQQEQLPESLKELINK